jgi:L-lactate dehydrogenase complex protein LldG
MTNPVIEHIRQSLNKRKNSPLGLRPAVLQPRQAGGIEDEIQLFLEEVEKLSGHGQILADDEIADALKKLVREENIRKAALWQTPMLIQLGVEHMLDRLGVTIVPPGAGKWAIAECDLGVTEAECLLPETGTIVLGSSVEMPQTVSLLPRIHLALIRRDMLRTDMHQVFAEMKNSSYLVFITGPSRTADIELTTTLGVHGPKALFVWVLGE